MIRSPASECRSLIESLIKYLDRRHQKRLPGPIVRGFAQWLQSVVFPRVPLAPALLRLDPMFDPLRNNQHFQKFTVELSSARR
jgi:hypothetical protein